MISRAVFFENYIPGEGLAALLRLIKKKMYEPACNPSIPALSFQLLQ